MRRVTAVIVLAGCNQVFGLDPSILVDADTVPAADVLPATCHVTSALEPWAATYLADNTSHGKDTELIVSSGQPALFQFGIDGQLQTAQHIAAAILNVAPITKCGQTACAPCPTGTPTMYQVYWNFDDWAEGQETSTKMGTGGMWAAPFAAGPTDRSALIVEAPLPTGSQLQLAVPMNAVVTVPAVDWIGTYGGTPSSRISLQVRTNDWAAFASDDHDESACNEAAGIPSLILTVCDN